MFLHLLIFFFPVVLKDLCIDDRDRRLRFYIQESASRAVIRVTVSNPKLKSGLDKDVARH